MTNLNGIWKNIDTDTDIKTLWFDNPEEATECLESMFRLVETIHDYIAIHLECWDLHNDCNCSADVLTFVKYK